jgi:hypothetical protein
MIRNEVTPFLSHSPIELTTQRYPFKNLSLERADERSVGLLRLEASVEKERVLTGPPGLGVGNAYINVSTITSYSYPKTTPTPCSDTNTVLKVQACLGDSLVVGSGSASNVELGNGNLRCNGSQSLEGVGGAAGRGQVRLGACDCVSDSDVLTEG